MLKEHATLFRRLMIASDVLLAAGSFILGYILRDKLDGMYGFSQYNWIFFLFVGSWVFFLYSLGIYTSFRLKPVREIFSIIIKAGVLSFLLFTALNYMFQLSYVSRLFIMFIYGISTTAFFIEKMILMMGFRRIRQKGLNFRNVLVVGTNDRAKRLIHGLNTNKELGLKIFGLIDIDEGLKDNKIEGHTVMGTLNDLPQILRENVIDHVMFVVPHSWLPKLQEPILYCETVGVRVSIAVDYFEVHFAEATQSNMFGMPFLNFEPTPTRVFDLVIKRMIDIVVSSVVLILCIPLFLVVFVLVGIESHGPPFFCQKRKGLNGREFLLFKYRTMYTDAEQRLEELKKHNEMNGPAFKMQNDPRVTRVGRFLRKTSIDELPQMLNVLKGDMSLVGPRPPLISEVDQYDPWHRRRLSMRPGITCVWQIKGRNKITDFNDWMRMDLEYIDNWNLLLDIKILLLTVPVVVFGVGAK